MRHSGMAALPNLAAHSVPLGGPGAGALLADVGHRAEVVTHESERADAALGALQKRLDSWGGRRTAVKTGRLGYQESADVTGLLQSPDEGSWSLWSVPRSLREVEPEVTLQLDFGDRSVPDAPDWDYARPAPAGGSGAAGAGRAGGEAS